MSEGRLYNDGNDDEDDKDDGNSNNNNIGMDIKIKLRK